MNRADANSPGILVSVTPEELKRLERWYHHVGNLTNLDLATMQDRDLYDDIRHLLTLNGVQPSK